jgi:7-cyano-7-deazaguanine synthase
MNQRKAVVLLSGGMDSATCLAIASSEGLVCHALSFDYGQRHARELRAAGEVARRFKVAEHKIIAIDLRVFGGSALTDDIDVPKDRPATAAGEPIPITYVPARNTVFLSYALAWAEVLGAWDIFMGANVIDYSGYPDCRPEYIEAFERMANLALRASVEGRGQITIHVPLIHLTKAQIVRRGLDLGLDFSLTHSCYDPDASGRACGHCDACRIRRAGFQQAGLTDPVEYAP